MREFFTNLVWFFSEIEAIFAQPNATIYLRRLYLRLRKVDYGKKIWIGRDFRLLYSSRLTLGERCSLGDSVYIANHAHVEVGNDFIGATGLYIDSGTHDPVSLEPRRKMIKIGDRVWCGAKVTILSGATIGDDVVIGAGSLVIDNIPSNSLAVGVPAKVIKSVERSSIQNVWSKFDVPSQGILRRLRRKISKYLRRVYQRCVRVMSTPRNARGWQVWALRRAFAPYFKPEVWLTTAKGAKLYLGDDMIDDFIVEDILRDDGFMYFPEQINTIGNTPLILDVGAHHGLVTVEFLKRFPKAQIIAVEPNPQSVTLLRKNLLENDLLGQAEIIEAAIGPSNGVAFLSFGRKGSWSDTVLFDEQDEVNGIEIKTVLIDTILKGRIPDIVKCNAEGAEYYLFPLLFKRNLKPKFVILMAHPEFGNVEDLLTSFREAGYVLNPTSLDSKRPRFHCFLNE